MLKLIRQGDVALVPVTSVPKGSKVAPRDNGRVILAYGEVTGHAHAFVEDDVQLYVTKNGDFVSIPEGGATLRHEEHTYQEIPEGTYRVVRQREYQPEEIRRVQD